jgi:transposase
LALELKRPAVNLMILWDEYRAVHPDGYAYSRYVAARYMWRRQRKDRFPRHEPQHKFERRPE